MQDFFNAIRSLAGGQVHALIAPSTATCPFVVYTPVHQEHVMGINGLHGLQRVRMQVDAYATTYEEATALQDAVLAAVLTDQRSLAEVRMVQSNFEQEAHLYRVSVDYTYHRQV